MTRRGLWARITRRRHLIALWIPEHVALILAGLLVFMVVTAAISGWALDTAWNAKSHEIAIARNEAHRAVQQSQQARAEAQAKSAKDLEAARAGFCKLIDINASDNPPPTTARGVAQQKAYKELGATAFLHCFPKATK